ncbi:MAG: cryptochrome/photolyase family protein, partial [Thermoflexus sp.]
LQKASVDAGVLRSPPSCISTPPGVLSHRLLHPPEGREFPPGEAEALRRLDDFTEGSDPPIYRYETLRGRADLEGSSKLSPYLRFGMLSPHRAVWAAQRAIQEAPDEAARRSAARWLDELIWREFFITLMFHFPNLSHRGLREGRQPIPWRRAEEELAAWAEGRTGYPLVDAGMRQLRAVGWMPNRVRMVVASFLTRTLGIDWRLGSRWFMEQLVDGDPAVNVGNWQWVAGIGTDYASAFRVFNPTLQARRTDPEGHYIRRWVPELRRVPDPYLHAPWTMPREVQQAVGCRIGRDYPIPLVPRGDPIRSRSVTDRLDQR